MAAVNAEIYMSPSLQWFFCCKTIMLSCLSRQYASPSGCGQPQQELRGNIRRETWALKWFSLPQCALHMLRVCCAECLAPHTLSPVLKRLTPGPTSATTPDTSEPGTNGSGGLTW